MRLSCCSRCLWVIDHMSQAANGWKLFLCESLECLEPVPQNNKKAELHKQSRVRKLKRLILVARLAHCSFSNLLRQNIHPCNNNNNCINICATPESEWDSAPRRNFKCASLRLQKSVKRRNGGEREKLLLKIEIKYFNMEKKTDDENVMKKRGERKRINILKLETALNGVKPRTLFIKTTRKKSTCEMFKVL